MMASPAWMPFYPADYLAGTGHLTRAQHGSYLLLILHYWSKGGLPNDDRLLARIARMTDREWRAERDVLAEFFDADWKHPRIEKELEKAQIKSCKRAESGSRGGTAKALKNKSESVANATVLPQQKAAFALASSSQPQSEKKEAGANAPAAHPWPSDYADRFWKAFPNRVGKIAALKALEKVRRSDAVPFSRMMDALDRYVRTKPPDLHWCHPSTWLNEGRWDDEPASVDTTTNGHRHDPRNDRSVVAAADRLVDRLRGRGIGEDLLGERPTLLTAHVGGRG